ncbi:MAG: ABC transporter ATP-binding protein [Chloroflexi bacterium]|nr:ABC transporter ATP-binding protein [Chloroflexota bacterium]MCL5075346.1 ABC transporter ATP-binding protein [Chloroflexota bacterium]
MELAIETDRLTKRFGRIMAVDNLNIEVKKREIFGILGPDGAGKTTTLRLLSGIIAPSEGTASVVGFDVSREPEGVKERIGYMAQQFSLYADLTVRENLAFFADLYRVPPETREERTAELLSFSQLAPYTDRLAGHLSGGMKKKLALSCTLIHRPELLLLDEPTTGVDPVARREFWRLLHGLLAQGVTIVVSTPYMDEAERCHTVCFLSQGKSIACDSPADLKRLVTNQVIELKGIPRKITQRVARETAGVADVQTFGDSLHLLTDDAAQVMARLRARLVQLGVEIVIMRQIEPSMEDVFMFLSGKRIRSGEGDVRELRC